MIYIIFTVAMILSFAIGFHAGVKKRIEFCARHTAHEIIVKIFGRKK